MPHVFWITIVGVLALLCFFTVVGAVLRMKFGSANTTVANMNQRIAAWWVMIAVVTAALWLGPYATLFLFFICSFFALREFITLTPTKPADYWSLVLAYYVALPGQFLLVALHWYGLFAIFMPVYMFFVLSAAEANQQAPLNQQILHIDHCRLGIFCRFIIAAALAIIAAGSALTCATRTRALVQDLHRIPEDKTHA